jgi:hypothetical protein
MAYIQTDALHLRTVVETPEFVRRANRILAEDELSALIDYLAANPLAGAVMKETGGARKLRWGAKGKGKSGGARVVTFYAGARLPVFLLTIFGKGEKANLWRAERNDLRSVLATLADAYERR